jgi:type IV pilus assembly protein PilC
MSPADRPTAKKPSASRPAARKPAARPAAGRPSAGGGGGAAPKPSRFWRRVPAKELMQFTGRLETLVNAGLPLVRCLRILENQQKPGPLRDVVSAVSDDVEGGAPLSEALAKYPWVFDRLYVNMVRAGEAGGVLGTILDRLSGFTRKAEHMKGQIRSAMTYPTLVMLFAGGILIVTMTVVVPKFEGMFESYDTQMPAITEGLLTVSRFMVQWWYLLILLPVLLVVGYRLALRSDGFAYSVDSLKLRLPVAGDVVTKTIVSRFCRTMGTLLSSGVPILDALSIVQASITNRVLEEAVSDVRESIREGESMARPLGESGVFDDMVVNMIDVGEETGQLDKMLDRIADDYEMELDSAIGVLFKALEPVMLLFVAVVVGVIAFALFSPMVRLMESFSGAS